MRSVLIHLTDGGGLAPCVNAGLAVAAVFDAKVRGCYAVPSLASSFWGAETAEFLPVLEQQLRNTAETSMARFRKMTTDATVSVDDKILDNALLSTIAEEALGYDLLVAAQPNPSPESMVEMEFQTPDLVVVCACPTLIVPLGFGGASVGERIVIAWNNSREASRAVRDSLSFLKKAKSVTVLNVNSDSREPASMGRISAYLNDHGISHAVASRKSANHPVTTALIDGAAECDADLLVMGAWGHSRLRELVLGGVTREIFEHMPIPVLMSH